MTYSVNSVADYIIEYAKEKDSYVNNLKLQKILYYLHARFLTEKSKPLFDAEIEKWKYGPVVPDVYYRFNHLGAEDIKNIPSEFNFMSLLSTENISKLRSDTAQLSSIRNVQFKGEDKHIIDETIEKLIRYTPFELVDKTHNHDSWLKDEGRILSGERHIKYDNLEIIRDFEEHPEFKLWRK